MALSAILPLQAQTPQTPVPLTPVGTSSAPATVAGISFGDILDTINPLQHIPVVSSVYRAVTGSTISSGAQLAGDTLYGAVTGGMSLAGAALGFASSVANVTVQQQTGKDIAGNVLSTLNATPAVTALTPASAATTQAVLANIANASPQTPNVIHALFNQSLSPKLPNAQYERTQAFDALNKHLVKMAV